MSDTHWTTWDKAELKKYIFKLKGEIDKLKSEKPKKKEPTHAIGYGIYNENFRLRKIIADLQNKDPKELDFRDDFLFVTSVTDVPINLIIKTKYRRSDRKISNARRMLAIILRSKGMGLVDIAEKMGYNDHTSVLHLIQTIDRLPDAYRNHLHHYLNKEHD